MALPSAECSRGLKQLRLRSCAISKRPSERGWCPIRCDREGWRPQGPTPPQLRSEAPRERGRCTVARVSRGWDQPVGQVGRLPVVDPPLEGARSGKGVLMTRSLWLDTVSTIRGRAVVTAANIVMRLPPYPSPRPRRPTSMLTIT
jgi:hypothetical protein